MKKKLEFSIKSIKINKKNNDDNKLCKIPKNNKEIYLSDFEFQTFKKITVNDFIIKNQEYIFPISIWLIFSYCLEVKFGNNSSMMTSLNHQLKSLKKSIKILTRNNISGSRVVIEEMLNSEENNMEKEIEKHFKTNNTLHIESFLNKIDSSLDFLKEFSKICLVVFKRDNLNLNIEISNIKKWKNYRKYEDGNIDEVLLKYMLGLSIKKVDKNKALLNIEYQMKYLKEISNETIEFDDDDFKHTLNKRFDVKSDKKLHWSIVEIYTHQLLKQNNNLIFNIDKFEDVKSIKFEKSKKEKRKEEKEIKNKKQKINDNIDYIKEDFDLEREYLFNEAFYENEMKKILEPMLLEKKEIIKEVDKSADILLKKLDDFANLTDYNLFSDSEENYFDYFDYFD